MTEPQVSSAAIRGLLDKQAITEVILSYSRAVDRFERRDGVWRIARRQLRWEWNREQPITETWARGGIGDPATLLHGGKAPDDVLYQAKRGL